MAPIPILDLLKICEELFDPEHKRKLRAILQKRRREIDQALKVLAEPTKRAPKKRKRRKR
jgi:hypothetical protein